MITLSTDDYRVLRLLRMSPFERRPRGGWRFGARCIADIVIERLIAAGRARRIGDRVTPVQQGEAS